MESATLLLIFALLFATNQGARHPEYLEFGSKEKPRVSFEDKVSYDRHQLWKVYAKSPKDFKVIDILETLGLFTSWRKNDTGTDLLVYPDHIGRLKSELKENNIKFDVSIKNLQTAINHIATKEEQTTDDKKKPVMDWKVYHRLSTIYAYLHNLVQKHPDICTLRSLGLTAENRHILMLKIGDGKAQKRIWLDGGMHAREWISPSAVTYIIDQIIIQFSHAKPNPIKNIEWYIVPVLNPDGYEYSHTTDRLWRKNRSRVKANSTQNRCYGVDLNRNFGYQWSLEMGTSKDPCSGMYRGPTAFSEAETAAVARFFNDNPGSKKSKWKGFISIHSYGQEIVYPWASRDLRDAEKDDVMYAAAYRAAKAVESRTKGLYAVGSMGDVIVGASGTSTDWARGSVSIKYSFIVELRDQGKYAFLLPHATMQIAVKEAYIIVYSLAESVLADP